MMDASVLPVARWQNFYVIVGAAAGALTGLQFVVVALLPDLRTNSSSDTIDAFATPTIVHFSVALFISAALSAPWDALWPLAMLLGATGLGGVIYAAIVIQRSRRQSGYKPVFEDWLWHAALPVLAYGAVGAAAAVMQAHERVALFTVGAATLLLVFIGIHNAWDAVTFIALTVVNRKGSDSAAGAETTRGSAERADT